VKGLAFGVANRPRGLARPAARGVAEQFERIVMGGVAPKATRRRFPAGLAAGPGILAKPPRGAMAGYGILLEGGHRGIIQSLEEIVIAVVLANMIKAKIEVFALKLPSAGCPVRSRRGTAGPGAHRKTVTLTPVPVGFDSNSIEIFRFQLHDLSSWLRGVPIAIEGCDKI
jgi:hypothetical protein